MMPPTNTVGDDVESHSCRTLPCPVPCECPKPYSPEALKPKNPIALKPSHPKRLGLAWLDLLTWLDLA